METKTKMEIFEEEILDNQKNKTRLKTNLFIIVTGTHHFVLLLFFALLYTSDTYFPNDDLKILKISTFSIFIATLLSIMLYRYIQRSKNSGEEEYENAIKKTKDVYAIIISAFWFIMVSMLFI